jgi:DNA-binding transcriptional ArsR family regulator
VTVFAAGPPDLGAVRLAWSPAWETLQAVRMFIDPRGRPYHQSWHLAVASEAARLGLASLLAVNPRRGSVPDFLAPPPLRPAPAFAGELARIRATPPAQVAADLRRCHQTLTGPARQLVADLLADPPAARDLLAGDLLAAWEHLVAPYWPRIRALLDADLAYRSQQLASHGLRPMLETIDPRITWHDSAITIDDGIDAAVELAGRGLVLMPSAYVWPAVVAFTDEPWQPAIVYPARGIASLWQQPAPPPHALARLIGTTRAKLLASLSQPASTTTLAALHGLSPSGTSGHLIALRDAGLITGTRHGHEIRYSRTRLGTELTRAATTPAPGAAS